MSHRFDIFSSVIQQLADLTDRLEDPESGYALEISQITVNLPIELDVAPYEEDAIAFGNSKALALYSSAPTQTVETTILPVLHRMTLTIVATDGQ